jgi:hypothetical protein
MRFKMLPSKVGAILCQQLSLDHAERELLPLLELNVWQNRLYLERLQQLSRNPTTWLPIWCKFYDGQYWVLDGHHRCTVAELRGDARILALVWK